MKNHIKDDFINDQFQKEIIGNYQFDPYSAYFSSLKTNTLQAIMDFFEQRYEGISAVITEKAFLWVAQKKGFAPIYIFNTFHYLFGVNAKDIFNDAIENCIDKVDVVYTEIACNDIHSDTFTTIQGNSTIYLLDKMIAKKSYEMGRELKNLENDQVRDIAEPDTNQLTNAYNNFDSMLANNETALTSLKQASENYLTHITPSQPLKNSFIDSIKKRNCFWMSSILPAKKATLVACGALHNDGQFGLLNLLHDEGYTVKPLMKTAPTPKSQMLKQALFSSNLFFKPLKLPIVIKTKNSKSQPNQHHSQKILTNT